MKYRLTKYKTLIGKKEILELTEDAYGQWIIYQNKKPMYHINCFDFKAKSNQILNTMLLAQQKTIDEVLRIINKRNRTNLTIEKAPLLEIKVDSEIKELDLKPIPLEWVK
jgi:hypothetical protein